jgi:hypothetical protein
MGIRKRFNKILGVQDSLEEERIRFLQRVNQIIFHTIDTLKPTYFDYKKLFLMICFEMGLNSDDTWKHHHRLSDDLLLKDREYEPEIRDLTNDDFDKTLLIMCILYSYIKKGSQKKWLSNSIQTIISRPTCDLGIRWKDGFFYPSGAQELDEHLIDETLTWLVDYPNEREDYKKALKFYEGKSFADVIKNCYTTIEGITRKFLGNDKTLDNNKDELLSKIGLSSGWKAIVANYINYAHDFRHASKERHKITKQELDVLDLGFVGMVRTANPFERLIRMLRGRLRPMGCFYDAPAVARADSTGSPLAVFDSSLYGKKSNLHTIFNTTEA